MRYFEPKTFVGIVTATPYDSESRVIRYTELRVKFSNGVETWSEWCDPGIFGDERPKVGDEVSFSMIPEAYSARIIKHNEGFLRTLVRALFVRVTK